MSVVLKIIASVLVSFETVGLKYQCQAFDTTVISNLMDNSSTRWRREVATFPTKLSSSIINLQHQPPELVLRMISKMSSNHVEELYLENNELTNLPRTLIALSKIESISLANNKITDISNVSVVNGFSRLKNLVLSRNPLKSLRGLKIISLENLEANNCEIEEIDDILPDCLPSLRKLNLTGNPLRSIRKLISKSLIELVLKDCHLSHLSNEAFIGLSNLTRLDLRGNKLVTMPDTVFLGNNNLRYLNLGENRLKCVTKLWFDDIPNLETLDLSKNAIKSIDEMDFARLDTLNRLDLAGNEVTKLLNLQTSAYDVNFSKNSIENEVSWDLSRMTRIRRLDLSYNRLEGDCGAFKSITLNILILGHNRLTNITKQSVYYLPNLTDVDLKGNKISTGISPTVFADNPNIVNVELDENPWSCNCTQLYPLYFYLTIGQRTKTTRLICQSPMNASGRTWWKFCGESWRQLMVVDDDVERGNRWIIAISAAFGSSLIFGTMAYIACTFRKNYSMESRDAIN